MGSRTDYQRAYYRERSLQRQAATEWRSATAHPIMVARKAHGFTVRGLASTMGISPTGIVEWEHGRRVPTLIYADKLAEVLGFASGDEVRRLCEQWQAEHKEVASGE